jgi:hypothetical protein
MGSKTLGIILLVGFITGTLDILAAFIDTYISVERGPAVVLKFIASGIFGKEAFSGGTEMIAFGLIFHFVIATIWTFIYYQLYKRIGFLSDHWIISGVIYGIVVWTGMNQIVVPMSSAPLRPGPFDPVKAAKAASYLIICIGLPNAYLIRKYIPK